MGWATRVWRLMTGRSTPAARSRGLIGPGRREAGPARAAGEEGRPALGSDPGQGSVDLALHRIVVAGARLVDDLGDWSCHAIDSSRSIRPAGQREHPASLPLEESSRSTVPSGQAMEEQAPSVKVLPARGQSSLAVIRRWHQTDGTSEVPSLVRSNPGVQASSREYLRTSAPHVPALPFLLEGSSVATWRSVSFSSVRIASGTRRSRSQKMISREPSIMNRTLASTPPAAVQPESETVDARGWVSTAYQTYAPA